MCVRLKVSHRSVLYHCVFLSVHLCLSISLSLIRVIRRYVDACALLQARYGDSRLVLLRLQDRPMAYQPARFGDLICFWNPKVKAATRTTPASANAISSSSAAAGEALAIPSADGFSEKLSCEDRALGNPLVLGALERWLSRYRVTENFTLKRDAASADQGPDDTLCYENV